MIGPVVILKYSLLYFMPTCQNETLLRSNSAAYVYGSRHEFTSNIRPGIKPS